MNLPSQDTPGPDHSAYEVYGKDEVEPKTKAATTGAAAGAITSQFILWGLDELFWDGSAQPDVPLPVATFVTLVVTTALAFVGGYYAKHVNR